MMERLLVAILFCGAPGFAQTAARDKLTTYLAEMDRLDAAAKAPYQREMAREHATENSGECPQANTTRAIEECLAGEISTTRSNYAAFTGALRSILALEGPGDRDAVSGPGGKPLTAAERVRQFDAVQSAWETFSKAQATAAHDVWIGGTYAPVAGLTCELMLLRSRMHDLNRIYDAQLRHH